MRNLQPGGEPLVILMIEDNPLDSEIVQGRLRQAGYSFTACIASTRSEFDEYFSGRSYDLILADYSLPDFDGLSALEIVRAHDAHVPFIFVSGVLGEDIAVETLHRGATDYVLKQRLDRLIPAVSRSLKEYSERLSRIETEALLLESEKKFQQMTNALPAMVWTTDEEGRIVFCNNVWKDYIGERAITSWCDIAVLHVNDVPHGTRQWQDALATGVPLECECRFRRASDGAYRWHLVRMVPLQSGDPKSGWVGTGTDVQAQKDREELLRTSEKLVVAGRMAGAIAHEINNPLEGLTNLLFLLRDGNTTNEPGKSFLDQAEQQLFRISNITKQTLAFYRDKAVLGDVDCRSMIEETVSFFRPKLRERAIQVSIDVESNLHLQARTGEIRQVLINLISNAIDAIPAHGNLTIRAYPCGDGQIDSVLLQIEDSGHGIPKPLIDRVFEPFFSTKGTLGTGLGLWVTREIIERHHGSICVESAPGRTIFSVTLPAEYKGEQPEARDPRSMRGAQANRRPAEAELGAVGTRPVH